MSTMYEQTYPPQKARTIVWYDDKKRPHRTHGPAAKFWDYTGKLVCTVFYWHGLPLTGRIAHMCFARGEQHLLEVPCEVCAFTATCHRCNPEAA